jgi:hypothetical protein
MPLTFIYNIEDPDFFQEIDHFFRYFKGLEIFNILNQESLSLSSEEKKESSVNGDDGDMGNKEITESLEKMDGRLK